MSDIIDVITKLTYDVDNGDLQKAATLLQDQVKNVAVYSQRLQNLQNTFDRTASSEIEKRTRISRLIQQQKQNIDATTQAIQKQVTSNVQLQNAIIKEIGLINSLDARLKVLQEDRKKAFDVKDIQRFNKEIAAVQGQIGKLTTSKGSVVGGLGSSVLQGLGIGTGIGLVTQGVAALQQFVAESIKLATQAEGVKAAFDRLNQPDLLSNLQRATKGTVSDLELMKNAVNFNNFGLPVEKLGIALDFARKRAKDTGQEVDFLVQSIVTGIGRQSPLILDNLGINAKRVADRFQETGDFALAAFQIIQEESAKAGADLDTFGEKQARLNATIQNAQVNIGKYFQAVIGGTLTELGLLYDRVAEFFGPALALAEVSLEKVGIIQDEAEEKQIKSLEDYLKDYEQVDAVGKRAIENQALKSYNDLIILQQRFFNTGQESLGVALQGQLNQYTDFFSKLKALNGAQKLNFSTFTQGDLANLNKGDLTTLKEEGVTAMELLTNPKEIAKLRGRIALIDKALERYSISIKKVTRAARELKAEKIKPKDEDVLSVLSTQGVGIQAPEINTSAVERAKQEQDQIEIERERGLQRDEDARNLRVQQEKDAFNTITNAAIQSYNIILQAQINAADAEIAIRQSRVNAAIELAKQGNTEILQLEQERLEESIRERQKYANRQAAINAALTVSQSILAIATAAGESGAGAIVIVPAVIAAIAAGFAAVTALTAENEPSFKDGVVDFQGKGTEKSDSNKVRISKGESVITAEATKKYKTELEAMNAGTYRMANIPTYHSSNTFATKVEMKGVESKLDELIAVNQDSGVSVKQNIDGNGVLQIVETNKRRDAKRF